MVYLPTFAWCWNDRCRYIICTIHWSYGEVHHLHPLFLIPCFPVSRSTPSLQEVTKGICEIHIRLGWQLVYCFDIGKRGGLMKSIGLWIYTPPKLNIDPWKLAVGRRSFPFGARPIFRGELLVSGRVCAWFVPVVFLTLPLILSIWTNYCPKQTEFYQQSESCHVFCFEVLHRWMTRYPKHRFGRLIEKHGPSLENIKFYTCFNFILSSAWCYFNLLFQKKVFEYVMLFFAILMDLTPKNWGLDVFRAIATRSPGETETSMPLRESTATSRLSFFPRLGRG